MFNSGKIFAALSAVFAGFFAISCMSTGAGFAYTSGSSSDKSGAVPVDIEETDYDIYWFGDNVWTEGSIGFIFGPSSLSVGDKNYKTDVFGINLGYYFKYPFDITQYLSLFPMIGLDIPVYFSDLPNEKYDISLKREGILFNSSFRLGAGFDFNFSRRFYIRIKLLYGPEFDSFPMNRVAGFNAGFSLGYRTDWDDKVDSWLTDEDRERIKHKAEFNSITAQARAAYNAKRYDEAVDAYKKAREFDESLFGTAEYHSLSLAYWQRAIGFAKTGDYRKALEDINASLHYSIGMSIEDYELWKGIVENYEKKYGMSAILKYGIYIIMPETNLNLIWDLKANGLDESVLSGSRSGGDVCIIALPEGEYKYTWKYGDENIMTTDQQVTRRISAGHIYKFESFVGKTVTATINDVTAKELPFRR